MFETKLSGDKLVITVSVNDLKNLPSSASGKTKIVATTNGNQPTGINIDGKALILGMNAYVKA